MKKTIIYLYFFLCAGISSIGQVSINSDGTQPDPSAGLEVKFSDKGFLPPRMTQSQIAAIPTPANGLIVFCTTDNKVYVYVANSLLWKELLYGTGTISPPFICGTSITIYHVSGIVAPVTKTVTYGTVTNIPGETTKCWITSNLGADHQATSRFDNTEASAGWYWQFNRKQGFKHDGSTRTPNTTWINPINENLDWQADNDPCVLELGGAWRIPTSTELTNVDAGGGWTNWFGPWNSDLKMHAAGLLLDSDGSLYYRGLYGYYWSSTQSGSNGGAYLFFSSGSSYMDVIVKALGCPIRCLRE